MWVARDDRVGHNHRDHLAGLASHLKRKGLARLGVEVRDLFVQIAINRERDRRVASGHVEACDPVGLVRIDNRRRLHTEINAKALDPVTRRVSRCRCIGERDPRANERFGVRVAVGSDRKCAAGGLAPAAHAPSDNGRADLPVRKLKVARRRATPERNHFVPVFVDIEDRPGLRRVVVVRLAGLLEASDRPPKRVVSR